MKVELDGSDAGPTASGLVIGASDGTIKGLVINRFADDGIFVQGFGATGNSIVGNFIGTNASGTVDRGNGLNGVFISGQSDDNTIGGIQPARRNLISGNGDNGVLIFTGATGNSILSNEIFANDGLGIVLNNDGVTPNDVDPDPER